MSADDQTTPAANGRRPRDPEQAARHESHLVGQIYHLIEANHRLEEQLHRLGKLTEIADLFREQKITRDTFEMPTPSLMVPAPAENAWARVDAGLGRLAALLAGLGGAGSEAGAPAPTPEQLEPQVAEMRGHLAELRDALGVLRTSGWHVDPDWQADVRGRLVAAEQAVAFLNEQSRELDLLRREKDSIMDGATRLQQNVEDLWKALNEKTTHIQRLEAQLSQIWASLPYKVYKTLKAPFRGGGRGGR